MVQPYHGDKLLGRPRGMQRARSPHARLMHDPRARHQPSPPPAPQLLVAWRHLTGALDGQRQARLINLLKHLSPRDQGSPEACHSHIRTSLDFGTPQIAAPVNAAGHERNNQ